jgi:ATP-dependent Clp protease ATP-binding subunit ClpB
MVAGHVPAELRSCTLFSLNLGSLLAGTGYRGDFEQRLRDLVAHLRRGTSRRILFIDELHLLGRAGKSEGGIDAGNLLKPLLARGELPCLGASTPAEWSELVQRDPALERRFQPIEICEPTPEQARVMLGALREQLERHHHVEITDDAVMAAITLSPSSGLDRRLPDRAVDWLDEACAMVRLRGDTPPSPDWTGVREELAVAEAAFDLYTVARIRSRVLPTLETAVRPVVDAAAVAAVHAAPPGLLPER